MIRIMIIILVIFAGCKAEKKISKAKAILNKYDAGSEYCASAFPSRDTGYVLETTVYDTVTLPAEVYTITNTVNDTIYRDRFLPGKLVTKTITRDSIIIRRDAAVEAVFRGQVSQLAKTNGQLVDEKDGYKKKAGHWRGYALVTWSILLAFIIGWIVSKIYKK